MNLFEFEFYGKHQGCYSFSHYFYPDYPSRLAVTIYELIEDDDPEDNYWEQFGPISINIPEADNIGENEFAVKEYSELEGFVQQLIDMGHFEDTGKRTSCGYVQNVRILRVLPKAKELVYSENSTVL
jgi:hypothetical protein